MDFDSAENLENLTWYRCLKECATVEDARLLYERVNFTRAGGGRTEPPAAPESPPASSVNTSDECVSAPKVSEADDPREQLHVAADEADESPEDVAPGKKWTRRAWVGGSPESLRAALLLDNYMNIPAVVLRMPDRSYGSILAAWHEGKIVTKRWRPTKQEASAKMVATRNRLRAAVAAAQPDLADRASDQADFALVPPGSAHG